MAFHFPGSATRPRRVSFEASSGGNSPHPPQSGGGLFRVENPLLSRPMATNALALPSTPQHASPFFETTTTTPVTTTRTASPGASPEVQQRSSTARTTTTTATASPASPPPPLASLSTGTGWIPSLWDEDAGSSRIKTILLLLLTQQKSNFLSPYSYSNLPNANANNSSSNDKNSASSQTDCWVLVFGFHTDAQRDELLSHYFAYGGDGAGRSDAGSHMLVREMRPCGPNAIALRYESPLQVVKALCRTPITLSDGTVCAVQALSHRDPRLVQSLNAADRPFAPTTTTTTTSTTASAAAVTVVSSPNQRLGVSPYYPLVVNEAQDDSMRYYPQQQQQRISSSLTEQDILLHPTTTTRRRRRNSTIGSSSITHNISNNEPQRSFCEQILRWILDIPDQDD